MFKIDKKVKFGFGLNIAILSCILIGFIMFFAQLFPYPAFQKPLMSNFKYYSLIVNTFELGVSIAMIVCTSRYIKKHHNMSNVLHIINLVSTSALLFNTLFTILYLTPIGFITFGINPNADEKFNSIMLFTEVNLFFNIIVPILALIQYSFSFKKTQIQFKHIIYALIPAVLYSIFYITMCLSHISADKTISAVYDWYGICTTSKYYLILMFVLFAGVSCLIAYCLILLNNKAEMTKNLSKIILYSFTIFLSLFGLIWMWCTIGESSVYTKVQFFFTKLVFITNLDNIFIAIAAIIGLAINIRIYTGKVKIVPSWINNLIFFAATFTIAMLFLNSFTIIGHLMNYSPWEHAKYKAWKLGISRHLLFEHVLAPFLMVIIYFLCEHREKDFKITFYGALPLTVYVLVYTILAYCNLKTPYPVSGEPPYWDPYLVLKSFDRMTAAKVIWLAPFVLYILGYIISWLVWLINRKIHIGYPKAPKILIFKKQ